MRLQYYNTSSLFLSSVLELYVLSNPVPERPSGRPARFRRSAEAYVIAPSEFRRCCT